MVCRLTLIEGLGGTGKTHRIIEVCSYHSLKSEPVLYLTYNRKVAEAVKSEVALNGVQVSTIHSLIYRELSQVNLIPNEFRDELGLSPEAFQVLEDRFLKYFKQDEVLFGTIPPQVALIVDEFQNTDRRLLEVLKLISRKQTTTLYLVGDRYQSIYTYRPENSADNFEKAESIFDHPIDERIVLNENHRSEASVLNTINSFLKTRLTVQPEYLYRSPKVDGGECTTLQFYGSKKQEFDEVQKRCLEVYERWGCKVAVLSRWRRNFKYFIDWKESEDLPWLEVSTIHGYIGNEAEAVFIVGLEPPESDLESQVLYTGLLRARRCLYLSTSFPTFDPTVLFTGEVVRIVDSQEAKTKPFKALKVVKMNKNLTRGKFERCMIDSVTLIVRDQDTPFIPYLERQPGLDNNSYQKSFITQTDIPIKVTYHKGQHSFIFTMNNVNRLRASDYTDAQVVKYFTNYILDFFDHRVSLDAIALQGIDLCRIVEEGDQLVELVQTGAIQCREQRDHNGQLLDSFRLSDIKEGTVYLNCSSVSTSAFTIAVYRPINKTNEFRYVDPKAIKIELRLRGRSIPSMYAFGMVPSVDDLLQWLKEDPRYLQKVFHSSLMSRIEKSPVGFEVDEVQKTA